MWPDRFIKLVKLWFKKSGQTIFSFRFVSPSRSLVSTKAKPLLEDVLRSSMSAGIGESFSIFFLI